MTHKRVPYHGKLTLEQVKQELPNVLVKWNGQLYSARLGGRLNQFASVALFARQSRSKIVPTFLGPIFPFAWETVTRAYNAVKPLVAD